ncbi:voltage-gated potassium channel [Aureococcus anophagefferens]|nr:voltage-gated potassium channel [Aureococcus anophagefferens]
MQRLFALASPQGEAHAQVQGLELSACLLRCLRPREDPFAGSEGGDDADEACQEVFAAVALGRTCAGARRFVARAAADAVDRALRRYGREIATDVVDGRGHRALAMRRLRAAVVARVAGAARLVTEDVGRALVGVLGDDACSPVCSPCQLAAARCCLSCARAGRPVDGAAILRKGLLLDLLRRNFYLGDGGALAFGSLAPYDARTVEPREAIVDAVALGRDALVAGADVPADALAEYALAVLAARHAAARPSLFLAQDAVPALGALLAPRAPMRRRNADDQRETRRFSPKGGFDAVAPDAARDVDAKIYALRALATVAEADGDGAVAVARELVAQGAANARSPAPRLVILDWDRDVEGADRPAARRLDAALSALVSGMGGEVLPAVNALCCCCEEHVLKGDADAALRSGAGDALADALHDAATPPACVVRLLDAFGRLAAPVARLEADLVPRVLLKRVVLTIRDKLLAAPPPDVARALCRALRDLAKADASGDALPFYLCTKWSCLAAVLVHPGDDPLLPSDGFAALGDLLEDRTPLLGDFGHLGFDDVDRQHECLRHLRENGDVVEARDVAAHLLGARLFRRAEDAEATRILAALARGPAAPRACVALVSKIVALYEDAKARRHKLDMREKRAEPSPADIAAAEARANRAAAELLEQLDEEATPPKKKKKKKKKKGHRDVAEAVAAEDAPADDKAEDGKAAAAAPPPDVDDDDAAATAAAPEPPAATPPVHVKPSAAAARRTMSGYFFGDSSGNLCGPEHQSGSDGESSRKSSDDVFARRALARASSKETIPAPAPLPAAGLSHAHVYEHDDDDDEVAAVTWGGEDTSFRAPSASSPDENFFGGAQRGLMKHVRLKPKFLTKQDTSRKSLEELEAANDDDSDDDDDDGEEFRVNVFPRHMASSRLIMNPLEDWRLNWDIFTMFLIVFVMLVTPFELAFINSVGFNASFKSLSPFEPNQHTGLLIANWFVNLGFVIDVVFNFLTAIYDEQQHRWIMSHSEIAGCYLRSWFVLDAGTIVPIEYFAGSEASLIRLLRLMRLFKLVKVLKSEKLVARVSRHIDMSTKFQTIIKYCVMMLVLIHWSACGLRMVTDYNLKECRYSADQDSRCPETACIWALIALNGEADARTHAECVLGMIIMLVGVIILAFLVGDMSNIMSNLDPVTNEFKQTLDNLNDYMRKKTGFPDALRLRLREYILLSEPLIVAKQNLGRTVTRMPFTAYTIHSQAGLKRGSRVRVKIFHDLGLPATYKAAVVLSSPALLRYDVKYDDSGRVERDVKHDRIVHDEKPGQGKLSFQVDAFVASVARLLVAQLYMPFDTVIHQGIDLNTVMYVVDSGKVICMNYDKTSTFGISLKQEKDFFGDDIAMLASGDRKPVLRDYAAVATRTTQLHALDAFEFLDFLEASPGLAVFLRHFEKWGCWVRMKRVFLDTKDILGCIRDADRAAKKLRKKRRAATLGVDDTADLLALVADAQRHGAPTTRPPPPRGRRSRPPTSSGLGSLVAALRKRREEA